MAYVTLNRPEAMNAIDEATNAELAEVWRDFAADDAVDVAILTGSGRAFCAGADLKTFIPKWEGANMLDVRKNIPHGLGGGLTRGQHRIYKPIIAAINGYAVGPAWKSPWPVISASLPKRPNSVSSRCAMACTKVMAVLSAWWRWPGSAWPLISP